LNNPRRSKRGHDDHPVADGIAADQGGEDIGGIAACEDGKLVSATALRYVLKSSLRLPYRDSMELFDNEPLMAALTKVVAASNYNGGIEGSGPRSRNVGLGWVADIQWTRPSDSPAKAQVPGRLRAGRRSRGQRKSPLTNQSCLDQCGLVRMICGST
jgi:hypothetical protein